MTREEAEALLALADRLWMVGANRGRTLRIAHALEEWQAEHTFDGETLPMAPAPGCELGVDDG